jgi:hypothetical protein
VQNRCPSAVAHYCLGEKYLNAGGQLLKPCHVVQTASESLAAPVLMNNGLNGCGNEANAGSTFVMLSFNERSISSNTPNVGSITTWCAFIKLNTATFVESDQGYKAIRCTGSMITVDRYLLLAVEMLNGIYVKSVAGITCRYYYGQ